MIRKKTNNGLRRSQRHRVNIYRGKPIDILSIKSNIIKSFKSYLSQIKSSRTALYRKSNTKRIKKCPVCQASISRSKFRLNVYGGQYNQCLICSHCFIVNPPPKYVLEQFYLKNKRYANTYADKKTLKLRIENIVMPKIEWMLKEFEVRYGRKPKKILDVGAGAGHFVYACRNLGLKAEGIEISETSRKFCRDNFGFDLKAEDFTKVEARGAEIVTFWGVLEHLSQPLVFLNKAYEISPYKKSLVIAEVPRWNSLSSAIQRVFNKSIIRHLDPLGHVHMFTDNSLLIAFEKCGFEPLAAWYFGMDAYELFSQFLFLQNNTSLPKNIKKDISDMQEIVDQEGLSDTLILAATKMKR